MDKLVMYRSSADSKTVHTVANYNTNFIIDLPSQLILDGNWELTFLELKNIYIYCDWCLEGVINGESSACIEKSQRGYTSSALHTYTPRHEELHQTLCKRPLT